MASPSRRTPGFNEKLTIRTGAWFPIVPKWENRVNVARLVAEVPGSDLLQEILISVAGIVASEEVIPASRDVRESGLDGFG